MQKAPKTNAIKTKEKKKRRHESNDTTKNEEAQEDALNANHEEVAQEPETLVGPYLPKKRTSLPSFQKSMSKITDPSPVSSSLKKNRSSNTTSMKQTFSSDAFTRFKIPLFIVFVIVLISVFYRQTENQSITHISTYEKKFPNQDIKFWKSIFSGINYTIKAKLPTSYIFLFESEGEETTKELLAEVSKYVVSQLTHSSNSAINFNEEILESPQFSNATDYGSVISHLKVKLETNGLMIIENFEKIPEKYALAFHSFCDEVSPLVSISAFFFTMKVDKFGQLPSEDSRYVEKVLRKNWPSMEDDVFMPLFTRISPMILRVIPNIKTSN